MTIEPFSQADLEILPALQPDGWKDITASFRFYLSRAHCFPIKAVCNSVTAGVGAGIIHRDTGWLAHIIVHPDYRRRGMGTAMVAHLKKLLLQGRGCRTLSLVATDMGRPVYHQAGFVDLTEYVFFNRETPLPSSPRRHETKICEPRDESTLLKLDACVSGEVRDWLLREYLSQALIYCENGRISGFFIPTLGDGLVIATTPQAGRALLLRKENQTDRIVLPADNREGMNFLVEAGFAETARCRRMILGTPLSWKPECIYSRIGGNLG